MYVCILEMCNEVKLVSNTHHKIVMSIIYLEFVSYRGLAETMKVFLYEQYIIEISLLFRLKSDLFETWNTAYMLIPMKGF